MTLLIFKVLHKYIRKMTTAKIARQEAIFSYSLLFTIQKIKCIFTIAILEEMLKEQIEQLFRNIDEIPLFYVESGSRLWGIAATQRT